MLPNVDVRVHTYVVYGCVRAFGAWMTLFEWECGGRGGFIPLGFCRMWATGWSRSHAYSCVSSRISGSCYLPEATGMSAYAATTPLRRARLSHPGYIRSGFDSSTSFLRRNVYDYILCVHPASDGRKGRCKRLTQLGRSCVMWMHLALGPPRVNIVRRLYSVGSREL